MDGDLLFVLRRTLENSDPQVRREAVQELPRVLPSAESKEPLVRARNDGYLPVRREALRIFADKYANEADQEFESALLDSNIAVREDARHYFHQRGTVNLVTYYSQKLNASNNRELCAAIAGVGETGHAKVSQLVERFFQNASSKVRAASLHAAAKLNPEAYLDTFVPGLWDTSSKVAREALLALSKKPNFGRWTALMGHLSEVSSPSWAALGSLPYCSNQQMGQHQFPHSIADEFQRLLR